MEESTVSVIITDDFAVVIIDGNQTTVYASEKEDLYRQVKLAYYSGDLEGLKELPEFKVTSVEDAVAKAGHDDLQVVGSQIMYKGAPIHNLVTSRILYNLARGLSIEGWVAFLDSALRNPCKVNIDDLYKFLEGHEGIPITLDGAILMYKKVDDNFMSYFTGKDGKHVDWSPGREVSLPLDECCADRNQTCAAGLHTCSREYLPHFYGNSGKVIMVKVFPEHIVSIPADYNYQKCRSYKAYPMCEVEDLHTFAFGSNYTENAEEIEYAVCECKDSPEFKKVEDIIQDFLESWDFAEMTEEDEIEGEDVEMVSLDTFVSGLREFAKSAGGLAVPFPYDDDFVIYVLQNSEAGDLQEWNTRLVGTTYLVRYV